MEHVYLVTCKSDDEENDMNKGCTEDRRALSVGGGLLNAKETKNKVLSTIYRNGLENYSNSSQRNRLVSDRLARRKNRLHVKGFNNFVQIPRRLHEVEPLRGEKTSGF